ncbi:MAG: DUF5362 family protein [Metallibacterium sp.]
MVSEPAAIADAAPAPLTASDAAVFAASIAPLARATGWMRACGVLNGVLAALLAITIIGLPFAGALVWVAFLEFRAASRLDAARQRPTAPDSLGQATAAVNDIAVHYIIQAVVTLVMVLLFLLLLSLLTPLLGHGASINDLLRGS